MGLHTATGDRLIVASAVNMKNAVAARTFDAGVAHLVAARSAVE
jgi:hypothetical protein